MNGDAEAREHSFTQTHKCSTARILFWWLEAVRNMVFGSMRDATAKTLAMPFYGCRHPTRIVGVDLFRAHQQYVNTNDIMGQKVCGLNVVQAGFCLLHLLFLVRLILSSPLPSFTYFAFVFVLDSKAFLFFFYYFIFRLGVVAVDDCWNFVSNERDATHSIFGVSCR